MTASTEARETALLAAQAAADKLATDVSIIDVSDRLAITDAFVLAAAPNERQVQAIVDGVEERLRAHGIKPVRREGVAESRWVLLDFVDVVVHVQHAEERAYYSLERLWKDCPTIPFTDSALPGGAPAAAGPGDASAAAGPGDASAAEAELTDAALTDDELTDAALTDDELVDADLLDGDLLDGDLPGAEPLDGDAPADGTGTGPAAEGGADGEVSAAGSGESGR